MATFIQSVTMSTTSCYKCGVEFGMPQGLHKERMDHGGDFWCPNGHPQQYLETAVMRAEKAAKRAQELLDQERRAHESTREQRRAAEAREIAAKGQVTKLKRRAAAGSCPCCKRNFGNLARHMQTKHPEFAKYAA